MFFAAYEMKVSLNWQFLRNDIDKIKKKCSMNRTNHLSKIFDIELEYHINIFQIYLMSKVRILLTLLTCH